MRFRRQGNLTSCRNPGAAANQRGQGYELAKDTGNPIPSIRLRTRCVSANQILMGGWQGWYGIRPRESVLLAPGRTDTCGRTPAVVQIHHDG